MNRSFLLLALMLTILTVSGIGSQITRTVGLGSAYNYHTIGSAFADINETGLADTVNIMLMDSVYNESELVFNPMQAQPAVLNIYQGGPGKPHIKISSSSGLPNAMFIMSRNDFVLYNTIIEPDTSHSWQAGVSVRSQQHGSRVYIQSGGVIGNTTQRGYDVIADSSATVNILGCLLINVQSVGIAVDLQSFPLSKPGVTVSTTGSSVGIGSCEFWGADTAISLNGFGNHFMLSGNIIHNADVGTIFNSTAEYAQISISGGADTVMSRAFWLPNGHNVSSLTIGSGSTGLSLNKGINGTSLLTRRNMYSMLKFAESSLQTSSQVLYENAIDITMNNDPGFATNLLISNIDFDWTNNAINVQGNFEGSINSTGNVILMGGGTSVGITVNGFGGALSTFTSNGDSIGNSGIGVLLSAIDSGTIVSIDNIGIDASTNGIKMDGGSAPASVSIGGSGAGEFSLLGASRARIRNNSRLLASSSPVEVGNAIDLDIAGATCDVAVKSSAIDWFSSNGININGNFSGSVTSEGNVVVLNSTGINLATGINVTGFGGAGSIFSSTGDSVGSSGIGVHFSAIGSGTGVSLDYIGIDASTNGIKMDGGSVPASVSIGGSGAGTRSLLGASRARIRNNSRLLASNSSVEVGNAIDLDIAGATCDVAVKGSAIDWFSSNGIRINGDFGGSVNTEGNVIVLNSTGINLATGIMITGFGGTGSTFTSMGDSIGSSGIGVHLSSLHSGTAVSMDYFGIDASTNGIKMDGGSAPASVSIGVSEASKLSLLGASRARVRNNARLLASSSFGLTSSIEVGNAIDLVIENPTCEVTVSNSLIDWFSSDGIFIAGNFSGSVATEGNVVNLNSPGGMSSYSGVHITGFGGSGATVTCNNDSVGTSDIGIFVESVSPGTAVTVANFGIGAFTNGVKMNGSPSSVMLGGFDIGTFKSMRTASRARVRNNARYLTSATASFDTGSAIDIALSGDTSHVTIQSTDVVWSGGGISITGARQQTIQDNSIDLAGSGSGIYFRKERNPSYDFTPDQVMGNTVTNAGRGIDVEFENENLHGIPASCTWFPALNVSQNNVSAQSGTGIPNFVAMYYRSKRSDLPVYVDAVTITGNALDGLNTINDGGIVCADTLDVNSAMIDSNSITGFNYNSIMTSRSSCLEGSGHADIRSNSWAGNNDVMVVTSDLKTDFSGNQILTPSLSTEGEFVYRWWVNKKLAEADVHSTIPDLSFTNNQVQSFSNNSMRVTISAQNQVGESALNVLLNGNEFSGSSSAQVLQLNDLPGDAGSTAFKVTGNSVSKTKGQFSCDDIKFLSSNSTGGDTHATSSLITGPATNSFMNGSTLYFLGNPTSPIVIQYQNFSGNDTNIVNETSQPINAQFNWWGTTDSAEIVNSISGDVNINNYLQNSVSSTTGTITGVVYKDENMNGTKDSGEAGVGGKTVELYGSDTLVASTTTDIAGIYSFEDVVLGTYTVSLAPEAGYYGTENREGAGANFSGGNTEVVSFGVIYDTGSFRTAAYEVWANSEDAAGKLKSSKRKADKVFFKFNLVVPASSNILTLDFGMAATGAITRGKLKLDTIALFNGKKYKDTLETVSAGDTIQVDGIGKSGKRITVKYTWGKAKAVTMKADSLYKKNVVGLPMPNLHNLGEELFPKGFGQSNAYAFSSGLLIGVPRGKKKANSVIHKTYADVLKSLVKESKGVRRLHEEQDRCLDSLDGKKKKPMTAQLKNLPPDKQDNALFAELLTLKLNIAASQTGKFPVGFGELTFDIPGDSSNPFNGLMVNQISAYGDTIVSCLETSTLEATFAELYTTVRLLNTAFSDTALDTLSFASKTMFTGVKSIGDVEYLRPTPGITPKTIIPHDIVDEVLPDRFSLYQNYPNPFNPTTTIRFDIPAVAGTQGIASVTLRVYNILGQEIAALLNREQVEEGTQEIEFNAVNLPSGVYFYRINVESVGKDRTSQIFTDVKRMLILK